MTGKFYDTEGAARRLDNKLSPRTLEKWRILGKGPVFCKLGGRVVYADSDLLAWVEAQRRTSTSDTGAAV